MKDGEEYFQGRVSLKAVISSPAGVLIQRHTSDNDFWDLPGGTLNTGEKLTGALVREVQEELGIDIEVMRPLDTNIFLKREREVVVVIFEAKMIDPHQSLKLEKEEVSEVRWIGKIDLENIKLYPEYHSVVEQFLRTV
jgi:8-oxo-dGTP pyrophosphatase MutT (NUDIX family)